MLFWRSKLLKSNCDEQQLDTECYGLAVWLVCFPFTRAALPAHHRRHVPREGVNTINVTVRHSAETSIHQSHHQPSQHPHQVSRSRARQIPNVSNKVLGIRGVWPHMVRSLYTASRGSKLINARLELDKPCKLGRDLLSCPDYSGTQPYGPADMPRRSRIARPRECPRCDYAQHDMRRRRMCEVRKVGVRLGLYPNPQRRTPGVDVTCCAVM